MADDVCVTRRADKKAVRQTISATSQPDLFWGMRGAGGNLGVAIEYTTKTFAVPVNVRCPAMPLTGSLSITILGDHTAHVCRAREQFLCT